MEKRTISEATEELIRMEHASDSHDTFRLERSSIYIVPDSVRILSKRAFTPQTVSFGPYHHGQYHLKSMEVHKYWALQRFLSRTSQSIQSLVDSLIGDLQLFKDAYDQLDQRWQELDAKFLKLMILDACFMMEIIYFTNGYIIDFDINDPVFSYHGMMYTVPYIWRDMLCIENQLPMLLLEKLDAFRSEREEDFQRLVTFGWPCKSSHPVDSSLHLLDLYRKTLVYMSPHPRLDVSISHYNYGSIPSAIGLSQAGIKFRRSKSTSFRDVYLEDSVLELPLLKVNDALEALLLNMMTFERLHVGTGTEVTSYVFFMSCIIKTERDVALLRSKGIIENMIGSDKAVATLFSTLSKDVTLLPSSRLGVAYAMIHLHCKKTRSRWRAGLVQTVKYFESTWAFLTLIAALVYFALTVAQTLYTVWSFYK